MPCRPRWGVDRRPARIRIRHSGGSTGSSGSLERPRLLHYLTAAQVQCDDRAVSGPCHADAETGANQHSVTSSVHGSEAPSQVTPGAFDPRRALALQRVAGNRAARTVLAAHGDDRRGSASSCRAEVQASLRHTRFSAVARESAVGRTQRSMADAVLARATAVAADAGSPFQLAGNPGLNRLLSRVCDPSTMSCEEPNATTPTAREEAEQRSIASEHPSQAESQGRPKDLAPQQAAEYGRDALSTVGYDELIRRALEIGFLRRAGGESASVARTEARLLQRQAVEAVSFGAVFTRYAIAAGIASQVDSPAPGPGDVVALGILAVGLVAAGVAVLSRPACPPCPANPAPEIDRVPPSTPHWPCPDDHWHFKVYNQNPTTCQCFLSGRLFGGCCGLLGAPC